MQKTISHYAILLAQLAAGAGLDADKLTTEVGLSADDLSSSQGWVENDFVTKMVKAVWRQSNDELFGLAPEPLRLGSWAICCNYMLMAETLGELYRRGAHVMSYLRPDSMNIECVTAEKDFSVIVHCHQGTSDAHRFLTEFCCITWHRFPCWAVDRYIPLKEAWFSYPAPDHHLYYEELFQCQIKFDQPTTGFRFDEKYLVSPVCRTRTELDHWLRDAPADLLYMPGRNETISTHIRRTLEQSLRNQRRFQSFDQICEQLHMSPQVVRRRLAEEGEQFQQLKDLVRAELIKELLVNTELTIAEITDRAGFQEVASLSRAFKKWTDFTPGEYRQSHAEH